MKLYDGGRAPNPRRVRIFFAEKNVPLPELVPVDIGRKEHRTEAFAKLNPARRLPVLELDDGTTLAETIAICRYIEALHPEPPLFGRTPKEIGTIDMWIRRVEMQVMVPLGAVWVNCHPATEAYMKAMGVKRFPDYGEQNRARAFNRLEWLDSQMEGDFIAGDFSAADIVALSIVDFGAFIDIPIPPGARRLRAWHERVSKRRSAKA